MSDSLEKINALLAMMREHDIVELEFGEGDFSVALRKQGAFVGAAPAATAVPTPAVVSAAPPEAGNDDSLKRIKSPIVGTFYRAPSPEAPSFVEEGSIVRKDSVVCIIEAMKIMNEVRAEVDGRIEKVLVESGEPVEYGQPLFLVGRNQ